MDWIERVNEYFPFVYYIDTCCYRSLSSFAFFQDFCCWSSYPITSPTATYLRACIIYRRYSLRTCICYYLFGCFWLVQESDDDRLPLDLFVLYWFVPTSYNLPVFTRITLSPLFSFVRISCPNNMRFEVLFFSVIEKDSKKLLAIKSLNWWI